MVRGRVHSREFTLMVVRQAVSGQTRPAQICREHQLSEGVLLRWRREYEARSEEAFTPRTLSGPDATEQRIADLERLCGQLALENAALKKALTRYPAVSDTP